MQGELRRGIARDDDKDIVGHPHDGLFKRIFRDPENAAAHFRAYLPDALCEQLEFDLAELIDGSYIEENLRGARSDLLYRVPTVEAGGEDVFIYVLFEHQRKCDPLMAFKLLEYMVKIWGRWLADNRGVKKLPPIVPMVLYNGKERWNAPREMREVFNAPNALLKAVSEFSPDFRYQIVDLGPIQDDGLKGTRAGWLALYVLKHVDEEEHAQVLAAVFEQISWVTEHLGLSGITPFVYYSYSTSSAEERDAVLEVYQKAAGPSMEAEMKTIADSLIEEGEARGEEKGQEAMRREFADAVLDLLAEKFGSVSDDQAAKVKASGPAELRRIMRATVREESIETVFDESGEGKEPPWRTPLKGARG